VTEAVANGEAGGGLLDAIPATNEQSPVRGVIIPAMVGLIIGTIFVSVFLAAFHAPRPHDLRVGVVGTGPQMAAISSGLASRAPGSFELVPYGSVDAAEDGIRDRTVYGAYVIGVDGGTAELLSAGANGPAVKATLEGAFQSLAAASGATLEAVDVVPTSSGDTRSLSVFYTGFGLVLAGFLFGLVSYQTAPRLRLGLRLLSLTAFAVTGGTITTLIAGSTGFNALPGGLAKLAVTAILLTGAVAAATVLIMRVMGAVGTMAATALLLILGNATGGGTLPVAYLPDWLRPLSEVLPVGLGIRALQGISYFNDDGFSIGVTLLAVWIISSATILYAVDSVALRRRPRTDLLTPKDVPVLGHSTVSRAAEHDGVLNSAPTGVDTA